MSQRLRDFFALLDREKHEIYLSIFSNNNDDGTDEMIVNEFELLVNELEIPNRIITNGETLCDGLRYRNKPESISRINWLSCVRNSAMEPFYENGTRVFKNKSEPDEVAIIFLNDIIFNPLDLIYLLETNNSDYSMACGMDFYYNFYDLWVTRGIDGNYFSTFPPYAQDFETATQILGMLSPLSSRKSGVPVKCCWNGAAVISGKIFISRKIRFRSAIKCDRQQSECKTFCEDVLKSEGTEWRNAIVMNPNVIVAYSKNLYFYNKLIRNFFVDLIYFIVKIFTFQISISIDAGVDDPMYMNCTVETGTSIISAIIVVGFILLFFSGLILLFLPRNLKNLIFQRD
jgi:hypothetical protein